LPKPEGVPLLIVFADRTQYEQFVPRFGAQFNSVAPPPRSSGYSFFGFAMSYWDAEQGSDRPVYTHEFFHSYLSRTLRIESHGDWLHEGFASMQQLQAHPQKNIQQIVASGLEDERMRTPFERLCDGDRIPENRYWQAATLLEMMTASDKYQKKLPALLAAIGGSGSTALGPHLKLLETSWDQLSDDWSSFCQTKYVREAGN
jgi:hypothetical protein